MKACLFFEAKYENCEMDSNHLYSHYFAVLEKDYNSEFKAALKMALEYYYREDSPFLLRELKYIGSGEIDD